MEHVLSKWVTIMYCIMRLYFKPVDKDNWHNKRNTLISKHKLVNINTMAGIS